MNAGEMIERTVGPVPRGWDETATGRTDRERIVLVRTPEMWLAVSSDPRIVELFGTAALPTPFLASMPAETVRQEIATRNPSAEVLVLPDVWQWQA
jgi:hypothetical protein